MRSATRQPAGRLGTPEGVCHAVLHLAQPQSDTTPTKPSKPGTLRRKHVNAPAPCAGLPETPPCAVGEQETAPLTPGSRVRPDAMPATTRRPREIDTAMLQSFLGHRGS